ncbi:nitrous oxide reductase accessory protein NosL [Pseudomonas sp. NA13]
MSCLRHGDRRFPGPQGRGRGKGTVKRFCSTAEMLGWWLQPENHVTEAKLYVHDMGKSAWEKPDDHYLIDATKAYYVIGTRLKGSMGVVLASFSEEAAARKLASEQGGRVLRFEDIDLTLLQQSSTM